MLSRFSRVRLCAALWTVAHQVSLVCGILQARILEWVGMPSSRGSSPPRDWIHFSYVNLHWQVGSLSLVPPGKLPPGNSLFHFKDHHFLTKLQLPFLRFLPLLFKDLGRRKWFGLDSWKTVVITWWSKQSGNLSGRDWGGGWWGAVMGKLLVMKTRCQHRHGMRLEADAQ